MKFRDLRADEIDCRVAQVKASGLSLLLYKDARCDMNILDETVGMENWQRHHTRENANCIVSIWDEKKQQWIEKEDTGTESNTEKEKGLASDSFKRACFNVGIGRELYTAPFIWVDAKDCSIKAGANGRSTCYDRFSVVEIKIENKKITELKIRNDTSKKIVYTFPKKQAESQTSKKKSEEQANAKMIEEAGNSLIDAPKISTLMAAIKEKEKKGCKLQSILDYYHVNKTEEMTVDNWKSAMDILSRY